jgi:hypothetical protein
MSKDPSDLTRDIINNGLAGFGKKPEPKSTTSLYRNGSQSRPWPTSSMSRSSSPTSSGWSRPPIVSAPPPDPDKAGLPKWVEYKIPMTHREALLYLGSRCNPCFDPECTTCKGWAEFDADKHVTVLFERDSLIAGVLGGLV